MFDGALRVFDGLYKVLVVAPVGVLISALEALMHLAVKLPAYMTFDQSSVVKCW
jgi:hypothetical protein